MFLWSFPGEGKSALVGTLNKSPEFSEAMDSRQLLKMPQCHDICEMQKKLEK